MIKTEEQDKIKELTELCIQLSFKVGALEQVVYTFMVEAGVCTEEELNEMIEKYNQNILAKVKVPMADAISSALKSNE